MRQRISIVMLVLLGLILVITPLMNAGPVQAAGGSIKIGTYGPLAPSGAAYQQSTANLFNTLGLDWFWAQYDSGMGPVHPAIDPLISAGKRIILRTYFWNLVSKDWTRLRANPSGYNTAFNGIVAQIDAFGANNLYGITFNEEEPSLGYNFWTAAPFTATQAADYAYGVNLLYDKVKAKYPNLRVVGTNQILTKLTDAQFKAVKMDALLCYNFLGTAGLKTYLQRGISLAGQMGIPINQIFTLIYAGMDTSMGVTGDPATTKASFEMAVSLGLTNIGFFSDNSMLSGASNIQNLLFSNFATSTDQYTHKQTMLNLISQYGGTTPATTTPVTPPPTTPPATGTTTGYVGSQQIGTMQDSLAQNAFSNIYSVTSSWKPNTLYAYVKATASGQTVRAGIYQYAADTQPTTLLAQTSSVAVPVGQGWVELPFQNAPTLNAGKYFIMINGVGANISLFYSNGGLGVYSWWGYTGLPSPWYGNSNKEPLYPINQQISMYVTTSSSTTMPQSTTPPATGTTTGYVGNQEIGTMQDSLAQNAFSNIYSVTSSWKPNTLYAYVKTAVSGQSVRAGIYQYAADTQPTTLLAQTSSVAVPVGQGWVALPFQNAPTLNAGKYFIMINGVGTNISLFFSNGGLGVYSWWGYTGLPSPWYGSSYKEPLYPINQQLSMYVSYTK
jgi:hypothetical protein